MMFLFMSFKLPFAGIAWHWFVVVAVVAANVVNVVVYVGISVVCDYSCVVATCVDTVTYVTVICVCSGI